MSLSHLESGCFLARKREASESENKETVTVKLEVVIMLVENSSLRFLRVNALKTEDAPERAAPVSRQQAFFQIQKLCCAKDKSSMYVIYEDMSHSRCNTMSIPNQYQ